MSDIFAEVSVRVTPDLTGFAKKLNEELKTELKKVKKPIIPVGLALERGALTKLRTEINSVITKAKPKPIHVKIVVDKPTKAALAGAVPKTAAVGAGAPAAAVLGAEGIAATAALTAALDGLATKLDEVSVKAGRAGRATKEGAEAALEDAAAVHKETAEAKEERLIKEKLVTLNQQLTVAKENQAKASGIARSALSLENRALEINNLELQQQAAALHSAALRQNENLRATRRSSQVQKGALSTSLTFAGVRGATLAASKSFLAGAATIGIFAKLIKNAADLEQQLSVFRATTSATAGQMEQVSKAARELGADLTLPSVTAADAAEAMVELAKAGLSVEDSIDAARGVLQLATAAAISNEEATRLAANALNAFGLAGKDAVRVADVLANSANLAQGSIADVGIAFQQAASAGKTVGLSFEDTSLFLTELAQNGLRGSDAGTSLRTALIRLIHPSKEAQEAINKLGIEIRDANGNLRPDVFLQLAAATSEMSAKQRDATIALIGGQDAFRALSIFGRQSLKEFLRLREALREQGTAAELAAARSEGLHGAVDALGSSLETLGTTIGAKLGPGIANFTRSLAAGVNSLARSETVANTASGALAGVSASFHAIGDAAQFASPVVLGLADGLLKVANAVGVPSILGAVAAYKLLPGVFKSVSKEIAATTGRLREFEKGQSLAFKAGAGLRAGIKGLLSAIDPVALAFAAAGAALLFFLTRESAVERATKNLKKATEELASAESDLAAARTSSLVSQHSVRQERENLAKERKEAAAARRLLLNLPANASNFALSKAQSGLAIALDEVVIAQLRLNEAVKASKVDAEAEIAARHRRQRALQGEAKALDDLLQANIEQGLTGLKGAAGGGGRQTDAARQRIQQLALQRGIRATAEEVRKEAALERDSADANIRDTAKRKQAWAGLVTFLQRPLEPAEMKLIFNSRDIVAGLKKLAFNFQKEGRTQAATYVLNLIAGLKLLPGKTKDEILNIVHNVTNEWRRGAKEHSDAYVETFGEGLKRLQSVITDAIQDANRGATRLSLARGSGASLSAQLVIAQQILANANRRVAAARKRLGQLEGKTGGATARKEFDAAVAAQEAAFNEVQSIQDQIQSDAQQAAEDAKTRAGEQTQAFIDSFQKREQFLKNRITKAGLSPQLADDKAATEALLAFYIAERNAIKKRIQQMHLHDEALKIAKAAIDALNQSIFDTRNEINSIQQQQDERIKQKLDLRIQLAEINENVPQQIRLHRLKLAQIQKELARLKAQHKKNTVEWLELKVAEAQEIKAINDLKKTNDDRNNAGAQLAFSFLQTQQGFFANLLGNLLPMGSIGGTLGNQGNTVTGAANRPGEPFQLPREKNSGLTMPNPKFGGPRTGAEEARRVTEANAVGGFTAAQAAMLIGLTKQVVQLLSNINGTTKHPEQKARNRQNNASFDHHK